MGKNIISARLFWSFRASSFPRSSLNNASELRVLYDKFNGISISLYSL